MILNKFLTIYLDNQSTARSGKLITVSALQLGNLPYLCNLCFSKYPIISTVPQMSCL